MISKAIHYSQFPMDDFGDSEIDELENEEHEAEYDQPQHRRGIPISASKDFASHDHDVLHLITYSFIEAKRVLVNPIEFFDEMPVKGGFVEPTIFLALCAAIYAFLSAFGRLNAGLFFSSFFSVMAYVSIGAFLANKVLTLGFEGKGTFEGTYRVFAFSKATLLIAWISVGNMQIGGWMAIAYTIALNMVGISKVHDIDRLKAVALVFGMAIIQFAIHLLTHF